MLDHKELLEQFWTYLDLPAQARRHASDPKKQQQQEQQQVKEEEEEEEEEKTEQQEQEEEEEVSVSGLDSLQASYFCKTIGVLLAKYPSDVIIIILCRQFYPNLSYFLLDDDLHSIRSRKLDQDSQSFTHICHHGLIVDIDSYG
jgi:hypothetical protein